MLASDIIRKKREKEKLTKEELEFFIIGYTKGNIPDYQVSAFLMAALLNGMDSDETAWLTDIMLNSGTVLDLSEISGKKVDKHSTGGVGDKTSLILAPVAAAAGVKVPMISGRGLGHTGGTLDKLESIPGFRIDLSLDEYRNVLNKTGAVLIGQTREIAPADKKLYALRDVTATVESIPLITGSIMSKKLAEGIDALVLDVKTGSGAFMKKYEDSKQLALSLVNTAKAFNKQVTAFITDMDQPLGNYIGNWLEVYECVKLMQGEGAEDLLQLSLTLSGAMLQLGEKAGSLEEGIEISKDIIDSGAALDKFYEMCEVQGGDVTFIKDLSKYPKSNVLHKISADNSGYLKSTDNFKIGIAALELGAGRRTKEDIIDPKAGIIFKPKIGDFVNKGDIIAELFTDNEESINNAERLIKESVRFSDNFVDKPEMIKEIIE